MSVSIVTEKTLNALMSFAYQLNIRFYSVEVGMNVWQHKGKGDYYETAGNILCQENYNSWNARYKENEIPENYEFKNTLNNLLPVQILKLCHHYISQSCESEKWNDSMAAKIIRKIEGVAIRLLPGYEEAKWELD